MTKTPTHTMRQLLEALEGARSVERLLSEIARPPRIDPDADDAVMAATNTMLENAYGAMVIRMGFNLEDFAMKARAFKVMDESTGGAAFQNPSEGDEAMLRQIVDWLAAQPLGGAAQ